MRWILVVSLFLLLAAGCGRGAPPTKTVTLAAGTKIPLILLKPLEAGGSSEGSDVPLMVGADVPGAGGEILIPRGSPAKGKVTWSRGSSTVAALSNRPARLEISIDETVAIDGTVVRLAPASGEKSYALTAANTGRTEVATKLDELWSDPSTQRAMLEIRDRVENGQTPQLDAQTLKDLSAKLDLKDLSKEVDSGNMNQIQQLLGKVRSGALSPIGEPALAVGAALELIGVAGQVGHKVDHMLRARTIRAFVGTRIEAVVTQDVMVKLVSGKR